MKSKPFIFASIILAGLLLWGCTPSEKDANMSLDALKKYQDAQPAPRFDYSQIRETMIAVQTAQANGTQTTSFWFARGLAGQASPIGSCPSLGFPLPASTQLTDPKLIEQTGVYPGTTDGTYVVCVGLEGKPFISYVEADVVTVSGPAEFKDGRIQQTGSSSIDLKSK
jgi:hypothetical protein